MRRFSRLCALAACVALPTPAHADGWFVVEAPVALATSTAQEGLFRPGVMPAIGAYAESVRRGVGVAFGLRVRGGVLRDGPSPAGGLADPGMGGLTTASVAMRVGKWGGWLELAGGGGVTGSDVVPAVEAGVGWTFEVGSVDVGPSVRYVRVVSRDTMDAFGTAELALVGVDLRFGRERHTHRLPQVATAPLSVSPAPQIAIADDGDRVVDHDVGCIDDATGCPAAEVVEQVSPDVIVRDDRIILDERVLFDVDRAHVKSRGRQILREIVWAWRSHGDWRHITIEGHTDVRGTDEYNQWLSDLRAERVKAQLVKLGCSPDDLTTIGFGRSRPRDPGHGDRANQRNRRVEFVIDRGTGPDTRGEWP